MVRVLMVLEVVLVVLEVTGPPVPWGKFQIRMSLRPGLYSPAPPIPHLLCRESYHLGSQFGTILVPFGSGLGGFKTVFLVILGLLKFVKNSPIKLVLESVGTGSIP